MLVLKLWIRNVHCFSRLKIMKIISLLIKTSLIIIDHNTFGDIKWIATRILCEDHSYPRLGMENVATELSGLLRQVGTR